MSKPTAANDAFQRIKRFHKSASVEARDEGFAILLDGRPLRTPAQALLATPTEAAARLIAAEWDAQGEYIVYADMPATRHAFTAIDRVSAVREEVAREAARYGGSDVLCYFAEDPAPLVERQQRQWGPLLDWAEQDLGLTFVRAAGISPQVQPPQTLLRIEALAHELDDFHLAALAFAGALFGSSILALALHRGRLSGEEAFDLSRLEEAFQEEQWGVDAEAAERTARLRGEAVLLERWIRALA